MGFWKVRVEAQGQVNEKAIKVEKFYDPKFEVYVRMPTFILDTEKYIEAEVSGFYPYEKTVKGDVHIRWFAKKVDYTTPLYNDSILYRQEYSYYHNISNTYRSNLYNARDGIPVRNISLISQPSRYGYFDPYVVRNIFFIYLIISYSAVPNFRGALTLLETGASNLRLTNHLFTTLSSHFFGSFMNSFHETEVQTVILRC